MELSILLAAAGFVVVVGLLVVYMSISVVGQGERLVVFRLGRVDQSQVRGPGLRFIVPIIDRPVRVDMRENFIEVPSHTIVTRDNAPINVDLLVYWKIVDPLKSVVNVTNFPGALEGVATTKLREIVGDMVLADVLSGRKEIEAILRARLDEVTEGWGGRVTAVDIREMVGPTSQWSARLAGSGILRVGDIVRVVSAEGDPAIVERYASESTGT